MAKKTSVQNFSNLKSNIASFVRYDELDGRQVLVVPCVMMTEGVHNGSAGPVFYSAAELEKSVPAWNHKPVVVYHPMLNGKSITACDKTVIEKQRVGILMNTSFDEETKKLKSEIWLDVEKCNAVDGRIMEAVLENKMMEVSTGLFTDDRVEAGKWNSEDYAKEAINHRPDHLAILPDQKGACSIEDGAGMPRINAETSDKNDELEKVIDQKIQEIFLKYQNNKESEMKDEGKPVEKTEQPVVVQNAEPTITEETKTVPVVAEPVAEPVVQNSEPVAPKTIEEFVANAPEEYRQVLINAVNMLKEKKVKLVEGLVANKRCKFPKEVLENKSVEELEMLSDLAVVPNYGAQAPVANASAALTVTPLPDPWKIVK